MIASIIGKTFLKTLNQTRASAGKPMYSVEAFFDEVFFPLFYDHEKYMQWVSNSPFDQASKGKKHLDPTVREQARAKLRGDLAAGRVTGGHAIGFPAENKLDSKGEYVIEYATTSSQLSSVPIPLDSQTLLYSWIGGALGVGVQGGLCIFFDQPQVLMALYEGWTWYRKSYLEKIPNLKGSQIETWNGQWLAHRWGGDFLPEAPLMDFDPVEKGGSALVTQNWLRVVLGVARQLPDTVQTGYVYSYGQTNRSIGFIPFHLPQINRPLRFYRALFNSNKLEESQIVNLYGGEYGFQKACEMGVVGLKAMEPKGLRAYLGTEGEARLPKYTKTDDEQPLLFKTYITWIVAMLNNEELWTLAETYAQAFVDYEAGAGKGKMDRTNEVKNFLKVSYKRPLLDALTPIAEKSTEKDRLLELGKTIHELPADNVPYFLTLIRFRYAFLTKK